MIAWQCTTTGSSPRVRGTRGHRLSQQASGRFIPACAGNAKHAKEDRLRAVGSSPRVRGTRTGKLVEAGAPRFIPACAGNAVGAAAGDAPVTVHPRVCGERAYVPVIDLAENGSSPRVRGTPRPMRPRRPSVSVHPRVCGERRGRVCETWADHGSSPRVRGTLGSPRQRDRDFRFIPACAGNACQATSPRSSLPVHPRVCGERSRCILFLFYEPGSSPRVRGTPAVREEVPAVRRFIPACAGNAPPPTRRGSSAAVHPRVCGERGSGAGGSPWATGSSPRVRGTPRGSERQDPAVRFIPACAGNASCWRGMTPRLAVHPRVCGEREDRVGANWMLGGSSPRVRGTRRRREDEKKPFRFIPACAGNAPLFAARVSRCAVHPRVCGERDARRDAGWRADGSSPRVRGTRGDHRP